MTARGQSPKETWKSLSLLEDWVTTGFSRPHPEIEVSEPAPSVSSAASGPAVPTTGAGSPGPSAAPAAEAPRPAAESPAAPPLERPEQGTPLAPDAEIAAVAREVAVCTKCGLSVGRTRAVPGEGPLSPPVMFIGEGPGADEDRSGRPFVGAAGQYLDTWLTPIGLARESCFIANGVKCRPPQNREPHPDELVACLPYLERQIQAVRPRVICCLGRIAAQSVLGTTKGVGELRGKVHDRKGIPVVVTYHPSAVLRDKAGLRKPVWEDLKLLRTLLEK
ncbi:MAG TPA: uracil-DNA glycosylase [Spirochaetia bacterium]